MTTAPTAKSAAATSATGRSGSRDSRWPAPTATAHCTPNAATTPSHTGSGGYRVLSTRVATNVLSGSSTGMIKMNAVNATTTYSTAVLPLPARRTAVP